MTKPQEQKPFCPSHPNQLCPMREGKGHCGLCGYDFSQQVVDPELRAKRWEEAQSEGGKKKTGAAEQVGKEERDKARWDELMLDTAPEEQIKRHEALSSAWETDAYQQMANEQLVALQKQAPPPPTNQPAYPDPTAPPPSEKKSKGSAKLLAGMIVVVIVGSASYGIWQDKQTSQAEVMRLQQELQVKANTEMQAKEQVNRLLATSQEDSQRLALLERGKLEQEGKARQNKARLEAEAEAQRVRQEAERRQKDEAKIAENARAKGEKKTTPLTAQANTAFQDPFLNEMVTIPAGKFEMGSNDSDSDSDEKFIRPLTISRPFALCKTEVTQGQWKAVMGSLPPGLHFKTCGDNCPVEGVNWNDVQDFIRKLNTKTGKTYRLPSEAEWEYACRAGGKHKYCGTDDVGTVAWTYENSPHPVAGKNKNAWGLYDMSGNVWEWVEDCYYDSYKKAPKDGTAWTGCESYTGRVLRGGSWNDARRLRAADRDNVEPSYHSSSYGFRLARTLP